MAYDSFAPVYTRIKRQLLDANDKTALIVLDVLAQHADVYGWAFPGLRRMADLCHYREETIKAQLEKLRDMGIIKIYETWNPRRHQLEYDYQISPSAMWIRDEYLDHAWSKWNDGSYILPAPENVVNRQNVINVEINVVQPATEPDLLKPELQPAREPASNPPPPPNSEPGKRVYESPFAKRPEDAEKQPEGLEQPIGTEKQPIGTDSRKANDSRKAETEKESPPVPAPPPKLEEFHVPLDDVIAETLAHQIRDELGTRLVQARQIVAQYGYNQTAAGIEYVRKERKSERPVKSPVGLLRWWLSNQAIEPDEAAQAGNQFKKKILTQQPWLIENGAGNDDTEPAV